MPAWNHREDRDAVTLLGLPFGAGIVMVGHSRPAPRSSEESGGWLVIEVAGEGVAESTACGCEVVAGEGGGVGGRHDARVGDQWPVGRMGLRREHVEAKAGEVPGYSGGRPAVGQTGFELALADHIDHGAAGQDGGPVPWHFGPGVILGEPLLADEHAQRTLVGLVPVARNGLLGL
jgi:hypothetical protein